MALKNPFKWDNAPPKIVGRTISIVKVEHSLVNTYVVLGEQVWGRDVHWMGNRSGFCTMDKSCPRCKKEIPKKWMGWLHVTPPNFPRDDRFLELTALAANTYMLQLDERKQHRGNVITVQRERRTNRSPIKIEIVRFMPVPEGFPRSADPTPTLMRLWNVNE